jgi:hypothetical protein
MGCFCRPACPFFWGYKQAQYRLPPGLFFSFYFIFLEFYLKKIEKIIFEFLFE